VKVAVTGATGTIGREVVRALRGRGDEVTALSRSRERARSALGDVDVVEWAEPTAQPAPAEAFDGADGVVHLLGERIDQRWSEDAKRRIRESRELGTRNLVEGMRRAEARPAALVSQSAVGYYGPHGDEEVDESFPPATGDFLAEVVVEWEARAREAEELGVRVVTTRTGVMLSQSGGALAKMLPPFRLGVGGPVAGGRQYMPWVHIDDVVGAMLFCLDEQSVSGPVNVTAPDPATNAELSKTLGRALRRPAFFPVPALAVKLLYGEMAEIVTTGARVVPKRLVEHGYGFKYTELESALRAALGSR
jgi:uncharacterized protein